MVKQYKASELHIVVGEQSKMGTHESRDTSP